MPDSKLREVYNAKNVAEASLMAQMLESEGIWAGVSNAALQNAVGDLPYLAVSPRVQVRREDYERARALVVEHQRKGQAATGDDWTCPRCSEVNGPAFDVCWNCTWEKNRDPAADVNR